MGFGSNVKRPLGLKTNHKMEHTIILFIVFIELLDMYSVLLIAYDLILPPRTPWAHKPHWVEWSRVSSRDFLLLDLISSCAVNQPETNRIDRDSQDLKRDSVHIFVVILFHCCFCFDSVHNGVDIWSIVFPLSEVQ